MRVLAYSRVSTGDQAESGLGLEAQRAAMVGECERRGWSVAAHVEDAGFSARSLRRPALTEALETLRAGEADVLMVAKIDRLSRSLLDFASLMDTARREGWAIVALDSPADMTTAAGEAMASMLATFAQFERRMIGERTRRALEAKRARGEPVGRPSSISPELRERIRALVAERGFSPTARLLNEEGVPTGHGGQRWWASSVRAVVRAG